MFINASKFVNLGIAVVPTATRTKRPMVKWEEFKRRLPTGAELARWFIGQVCNYAIVTGWQRLVVVDFDSAAVYGRWLRWAAHVGGIAQRVAQTAYRVQSARGVHVYLKVMAPTPNMHIPGEVDILARHKLVTGPGSIHATGAVYTPMNVMHFPVIETLSDALPASLLITGAPRPAAAFAPLPAPDNDPWHPVTRPDLGQGPVSHIKATWKLTDLLQIKQRRGAWHTVHCPFHDDENPSAGITPDGERFVCFAGCNQRPWDVIEVFAAMHGLSNREAIFEMSR